MEEPAANQFELVLISDSSLERLSVIVGVQPNFVLPTTCRCKTSPNTRATCLRSNFDLDP